MPSFQTDIPHNLGKENAKERLRKFVDDLGTKYAQQVSDVQGEWHGDTLDFQLSTYGINIGGKIEVQEDRVHVAGEVPFTAAMFKGKISESIREGIQRALA
jgi:putative polyhydroxyalkanoate system protein